MPNNLNIPTLTNPVLAGLVLALRKAGIRYASNGFRHYGNTHRTGTVNHLTIIMLRRLETGTAVSQVISNQQVIAYYISAAAIELESLKAQHQAFPRADLETKEGKQLANQKLHLMHRQIDCQTIISIFSDLMNIPHQPQA